MASGGEEIELLKHVSPVKPREDFCPMKKIKLNVNVI